MVLVRRCHSIDCPRPIIGAVLGLVLLYSCRSRRVILLSLGIVCTASLVAASLVLAAAAANGPSWGAFALLWGYLMANNCGPAPMFWVRLASRCVPVSRHRRRRGYRVCGCCGVPCGVVRGGSRCVVRCPHVGAGLEICFSSRPSFSLLACLPFSAFVCLLAACLRRRSCRNCSRTATGATAWVWGLHTCTASRSSSPTPTSPHSRARRAVVAVQGTCRVGGLNGTARRPISPPSVIVVLRVSAIRPWFQHHRVGVGFVERNRCRCCVLSSARLCVPIDAPWLQILKQIEARSNDTDCVRLSEGRGFWSHHAPRACPHIMKRCASGVHFGVLCLSTRDRRRPTPQPSTRRSVPTAVGH